jgi:hypothetical protein
MEEATYTLTIRHPDTFSWEVHIPEIGATTPSCATLDSALNLARHVVEKHLTTRQLILVFVNDETSSEERERQIIHEVEQQGLAPQILRREHHLVFSLSQPLTREQMRWLDGSRGKLFYRYFVKDETEIGLEQLLEAKPNRGKLPETGE